MPQMMKTLSFSIVTHIPFLTEMAIGFGIYLICLLLFFRKKKPLHNFWLAILFIYLGALWGATISLSPPNMWHYSAKSTAFAIKQIQWVPFVSAGNILHNSIRIGNYKEFIRIVGGNFIMLMPLGVLIPLINPRFRLARMVLVAILVPVGIEGLQLVSNILMGNSVRTVEMEDVILNAAGCILAYLIFAGLRSLFQPKKKGKHYSAGRQ